MIDLALGSRVLKTHGLSLAAALSSGAMASSDAQSQPTPPPPGVPAPETVPKLPQSIFNLEKQDSTRRPGPHRQHR